MAVHQDVHGSVLVLTVDNPPVNPLSQVERAGLLAGLERAAGDDGIGAIVIAGANQKFIAGADIKEFGKTPEPPHLPDVINAIEASEKPVVAAIGGPCLGGGLEVALGCHYRTAQADALLGLPEVTLGIVPGAGGTQRLPRLIGAAAAAEMITSGKPMKAKATLENGVIDSLVETDVLAAAIALAEDVAGQSVEGKRLSSLPCPSAEGLEAMEKSVARKARGAKAPIEALGLVKAACTLPFAEGLEHERETFLALRATDQAKALRHIFFAETAAKKAPADVKGMTPRPVSRIGVIGAGTMGTGIAISLADGGYDVTLLEIAQEALDRGLGRITKTYQGNVAKGRMSESKAKETAERITGTTTYADLGDCDLIIEAAFESLQVKKDIFAALDEVAKPGAVLATNTSYLDINEIAATTSRASDILGMHYFSPANIMKLLEIVRAEKTAGDALLTALTVAKKTRKQPVVAGVCHGFIGNRMLRGYQRESGLLLMEGASPAQVDAAITAFGFAMGPFSVSDLAGIDIGYKSRKDMAPGSYEPHAVIVSDKLAEAEMFGQKSGKGFYVYDPETRSKTPNPAALTFIEEARAELGFSPREISPEEIVERCLLGLFSEGAALLEEGIAQRASDIDVVYTSGYGFPRHQGGPMFWAQNKGLCWAQETIAKYAQGPYGKWWPQPGIIAEGAAGKGPLANG
ncbi:MAG: 3-hydroxyacyl-CoA dehydrogenase NAD-binding domain-containing protein [Pseudomonadota bacterium]